MIKCIIKKCHKHGKTKYSLRSSGYYRCRKCSSEAVTKRRKKARRLLLGAFGGKCSICGYNKYNGALQFHHKNPQKKDFGLSVRGQTRSYKKMLEEAKKCKLVCANCHAELHSPVTQ